MMRLMYGDLIGYQKHHIFLGKISKAITLLIPSLAGLLKEFLIHLASSTTLSNLSLYLPQNAVLGQVLPLCLIFHYTSRKMQSKGKFYHSV